MKLPHKIVFVKSIQTAFLSICKRILSLVVFLIFSLTLVAEENSVEIINANTGTKVVYKANGKNSVVITEGSITAEPGKSVKLLPGTHLKGEEPVKVNIVSREQQKALAYKAEKEKERKFYVFVFERLKDAERLAHGQRIVRTHFPIPGGRTFLGQQVLYSSALPVQSGNSFSVLFFILKASISIQNIHNLKVSAFRDLHFPDLSWGTIAETVKILRC